MKGENKMYTQLFEYKKRDNGEGFYSLKNELSAVSKALGDLVQSIHTIDMYDSWPNDWVYEQVFYAFERLEQCSCDFDYERSICDLDADVYTHDLLKWVSENGFAREFVQEELDEGEKPESIDQLISMAQIRAKERIYSRVWEFIKNNKEGEQ